MQRKSILIVGGAGYIGSHVNELLHRKNYHTVILDNLSRGHRSAISKGIFIEGDFGDPSVLKHVFQSHSIQAVMHFAASIDVRESFQHPAKYYVNNVARTIHLLNSMIEHEVKYLIFSSSAAIYGQPQKLPIKEDHPCDPINPYGTTKWMIEKILKDFDVSYNLKSCCLRYFNAAGGDSKKVLRNYQSESHLLIPRILLNLKRNVNQVTIYGTDYSTPDGTCIRDYVHVEDLGAAHITAMEQLLNGSPSSCYNLGNGEGFSVREVITVVEDVLKKKMCVVEEVRRPGDPPILLADAAKANLNLKWQPAFTLQDMIEHAWCGYGLS